MKKSLFFIAAIAALVSSSCKKIDGQGENLYGILSFDDFAVVCDESVETKAASAAGASYAIFVYDQEGSAVISTTYAAVKESNNKLSIPAGNYTLEARSTVEAVPVAAFEQPVYGASTSFSVAAGETTSLGSLTCTLTQVKVSVSYSDEFLKDVTGPGSATVEVTAGYPLSYDMTYSEGNVSYEQSAGYFAVNDGSTMVVTFKGSVGGKTQKMTKSFTGIAARQWRQVKFIKKVNEQGQATFDIVIDDLVSDQVLNNDVAGSETIIAEDPNAPKGDGGITFDFDYAGGCDAEFTDLEHLVIPQQSERTICLKFNATVPNGVKKFWVDITSTNESFVSAIEAADAAHLDLINPSETNMIIFQVVPFPHGPELVGQTSMAFDMSAAQEAIVLYQGTHSFNMNIVDTQGCKKTIPVVMIVE